MAKITPFKEKPLNKEAMRAVNAARDILNDIYDDFPEGPVNRKQDLAYRLSFIYEIAFRMKNSPAWRIAFNEKCEDHGVLPNRKDANPNLIIFHLMGWVLPRATASRHAKFISTMLERNYKPETLKIHLYESGPHAILKGKVKPKILNVRLDKVLAILARHGHGPDSTLYEDLRDLA